MFGTTGILVGAAVAATIVGGFVYYFNWSQDRIDALSQNVAKLRISTQTNQQTIETMTNNFNRFSTEANRLSVRVNEIRTQTSKLAELFAEINLDALAAHDAPALQDRINQETQQILDDLEAITAPQPEPSQ